MPFVSDKETTSPLSGAEGKLFLCATPIGNLKDITLRVLETLKEVDLIAAEDTRTTKKLLTHYQIHKPLISFYKDNEAKMLPKIIALLKAGKKIAQVSEAGLPGIADPGHSLIKACLKEGITFEVLPGPSALLMAAVLSGLPTDDIRFLGFLPKRKTAKERMLQTLKYQPSTLVFFETAIRLKETLEAAKAVLGDREAFVGRELTKKFEQHLRDKLSHIIQSLPQIKLKGELVLVIAGTKELPVTEKELQELLNLELQRGTLPSEAIKLIAHSFGLPKKQVYKLYLDIEEKGKEEK